jgi:LuxR family maltose regulon positive regulatory protein
VDYAGKLLTALEAETRGELQIEQLCPSPLIAQPLVDRLSDRELEVLRLLATHLSGPEIAQNLIISVSTLRSHTKSIYSKLNVHSRSDAVERARELNLI